MTVRNELVSQKTRMPDPLRASSSMSGGSITWLAFSPPKIRKMRSELAGSKAPSGSSSADRSASRRSTWGASSLARGVGRTPCAVRVKSGSPKVSRRRLSEALTAGWLRNSRVAARETLPSRISASKVRSMPTSRLRISRLAISHIHSIEWRTRTHVRMVEPLTKPDNEMETTR